MRLERNKDISGMRVGRLTVICWHAKYLKTSKWLCRCECGNQKVVEKSRLVTNRTKSCGCLMREAIKKSNTKHGLYGTKTYICWQSMIKRCENSKCRAYKNYGGRGIKVCERWHKFELFVQDMGLSPPGLDLDRIDNEGDYQPGNCRWTTRKINMNNRRCSKKR